MSVLRKALVGVAVLALLAGLALVVAMLVSIGEVDSDSTLPNPEPTGQAAAD